MTLEEFKQLDKKEKHEIIVDLSYKKENEILLSLLDFLGDSDMYMQAMTAAVKDNNIALMEKLLPKKQDTSLIFTMAVIMNKTEIIKLFIFGRYIEDSVIEKFSLTEEIKDIVRVRDEQELLNKSTSGASKNKVEKL